MTKRELIDDIRRLNPTAKPEFLSGFGDEDLGDYLSHLHAARTAPPRPSPDRLERYFRNLPVLATRPAEEDQVFEPEPVTEAGFGQTTGQISPASRPTAVAVGLEDLVHRAWTTASATATLRRPGNLRVFAEADEESADIDDVPMSQSMAIPVETVEVTLPQPQEAQPLPAEAECEPDPIATDEAQDATEPDNSQASGVREAFLF